MSFERLELLLQNPRACPHDTVHYVATQSVCYERLTAALQPIAAAKGQLFVAGCVDDSDEDWNFRFQDNAQDEAALYTACEAFYYQWLPHDNLLEPELHQEELVDDNMRYSVVTLSGVSDLALLTRLLKPHVNYTLLDAEQVWAYARHNAEQYIALDMRYTCRQWAAVDDDWWITREGDPCAIPDATYYPGHCVVGAPLVQTTQLDIEQYTTKVDPFSRAAGQQ